MTNVMKYSNDEFKKYGLYYYTKFNPETFAPEIIVEDDFGEGLSFNTTMIKIKDENIINVIINKYIREKRKEKLIRLNEI